MKHRWLLAFLSMVLAGGCGDRGVKRPEPGPARSASARPAPQPAPAAETMADHLARLRPTVPAGFTLVEQHPFVVIGDEAPGVVRRRATGTVQWAVDHLQKAFFRKEPKRILDIWLFKNKASYELHCRKLWNMEPISPYGFFSPRAGALIMNIATGGGTLVHEIVHPFVAADFPRCPTWFNEGLASLYEQCHSRDGRILGLTNWRLRGLQEAIRKGATVPFTTLLATTGETFYNGDKGTNYAQARYLCYWLQEKRRLRDFYRVFRRDAKTDPTGIKTLEGFVDEGDLAAFQKRWERWVLTLRYR